MDKKSKEQFPGPNPEMGVGGDAVAEFERRIIIERLEGLIEALNEKMSLRDVAATLRTVAHQLEDEYVSAAVGTCGEFLGDDTCACEGSYICPMHAGLDNGASIYEL